jgi:hypothetical protein
LQGLFIFLWPSGQWHPVGYIVAIMVPERSKFLSCAWHIPVIMIYTVGERFEDIRREI